MGLNGSPPGSRFEPYLLFLAVEQPEGCGFRLRPFWRPVWGRVATAFDRLRRGGWHRVFECFGLAARCGCGVGEELMSVAFWSPKGGSGVSSVAAMTGATLSQQGRAVRLVDLCGELPALFGLDEPVEGLASWSIEFEASGGDFDDLSVELDPALSMVARGLGRLRSDLLGGLFRWVESSPADVVVDAGTLWPDDESASWPTRSALVTAADLSVLVTRPLLLVDAAGDADEHNDAAAPGLRGAGRRGGARADPRRLRAGLAGAGGRRGSGGAGDRGCG